ncbi:MAG TPA: hypothetical protein VFU05_10985 [Cyclobacteriaceae bacterium]|nr:hypothetical protein [Cyclobacteriaceae bacterium]
MKNRPLSITLISFLFIGAGIAGIIYHADDWRNITAHPEETWVLFLRLLAIVGGMFALTGKNWARWLLLAWIVFHVVLSIFHPVEELIMHIIITIIIAIALFNRRANSYFQKK